MQDFGKKSEDLMGVFNSCWVFGRAKCYVYKPKEDHRDRYLDSRITGTGTLIRERNMRIVLVLSQRLRTKIICGSKFLLLAKVE